MNIYLPIAEMSMSIFLPLGLGAAVGILSGLFGVGGGFLMTPLLIFIGVPPAVAVATEANQIVASSVSGVLAHWRRRNVDIKMGIVLLIGGVAGSVIGVQVFAWLRSMGQIDFVISVLYVVFLGSVGSMMLIESVQSARAARREAKSGETAKKKKRKEKHPAWVRALPGKMVFRRSRLVVSPVLPFGVGFLVGILAALMGVGGGFIMVPAMIYLIGMPTQVVVGTSLFQIIFVTANTTFFQAIENHAVDVVLALMLLIGGVIGAQVGTRLGVKLKGEQLRGLLAVMVLAVCVKMLLDLVIMPDEIYNLQAVVGH